MTQPSMQEFGAVLFTLDVERLATFYTRLLEAIEVERSKSHVALGRGGLRLTLHAIAPAYRKKVRMTTPPKLRDESAVKLAFAVQSIAATREIAITLGGGLHDASREFTSGARTLCDGHDPDGNVIQVWQTAAQRAR